MSDFTRSDFWFQSQATRHGFGWPPFSCVETPFRVHVQDNIYSANCVWDALGIAAALHADAIIEASDGQSGEPMMQEVRHGQPVPEECVIHFALPAARWWDDIIYTRATMLLFRSEETVTQWCEARGLPKRPRITLNQLWYLAMTWYENRLTVESRRPAPDEMGEILHGLVWKGHSRIQRLINDTRPPDS